MQRSMSSVLLGTALMLALAGCGGSTAHPPPIATIPPCARSTSPVALPAGFPASFPFPPGTVFTQVEHRAGRLLLVRELAPITFVDAVKHMYAAVPCAGFRQFRGEAEPPRDAESEFECHGYLGRWRTTSIPNCPGAITVWVYALPSHGA